jgi:hypothetical protein
MGILPNKDLNKVAKTSIALVLASTITFSTTQAYANEQGEADSIVSTTENVEENEITQNDQSVDRVIIDSNEDSKAGEVPSIIPGDFFYFAKLALEKIKLAFTLDDEKEAKLIAEFATERLAEAEALFAEGNDEKAIELLENALSDMDELKVLMEEDHLMESDNHALQDPISNEEANEEENLSEEVEEDQEGTTHSEIEIIFSQHIIALQSAMEKVKNPTAKAALQKNIEKSYAKFFIKISKMEAESEGLEVGEVVNDFTTEKVSTSNEATIDPDSSNREDVETIRSIGNKSEQQIIDASKATHRTTNQLAKQKQETAKEIDNQKKEKIKQNHELAKEKAKENSELAKETAKQNREAAKDKAKKNRENAQNKVKELKQNGKPESKDKE